MSLTALGPLERPEPLLGARNYPPSAQKLKSALDNLQSALTNVLIKFFIDRMNATHRWHETAAEIDPALSDFMEVISNYLRVFYVSEPQWRKGPVVVLNPPIKFGPTFKDLAHTPLLSSFAKTIDEAEKSLTVQDLSYAGFPNPLS